ncbi:MAG: hypothetical protein ACU0DH_06780 [Paracoccus sp. (in: a-proteobacteria)]|uniref:hypothetical protein n=1 Tax=Paracoccus sp. TaxID=267 RepID=UPI004059C781
MTLKTSASSALLIALFAAGSASAQTMPTLPPLLQDLGLQQVETETKRDGGREYEGRLADGTEIEARFDASGGLDKIEADDGVLPQSIVEALLPQPVRDTQILSEFGMIEEIRTRDGRFDVKGEDADGVDLRASFDEAGNVLRFGRDDDDRRGGRGGPGRHGEHGHGRPGKGDRDDGPRASMQDAAQSIDTVAVNRRLSEAGYGQFGLLRQDGPRLLLDATNPDGEAVTLEFDPQGEVVRETAR